MKRAQQPAPEFYGVCAVILGVWEAAAYRRYAPTITSTMRRHWSLRLAFSLWLLGLARHILRAPR